MKKQNNVILIMTEDPIINLPREVINNMDVVKLYELE